MIQVDNKNILEALVNHEEGELALVKNEEKIYQYKDGKWVEYIPEDGKLGLSIYEINQQIVPQLPNLDADQIQNGINIIDQFTVSNSYYMLLCRDINYYTVLLTGNEESDETVGQAVIDCFAYMGAELKAIDLTDDGTAVEIWFVIPNEELPAMCAYLFQYDEAVILCK